MEYLDRSIAIADELRHDLERDDCHASSRLQRCVSEILPLFEKLKKFRCPWGSNTLCALRKLLEALESMHRLMHVHQDTESTEELEKWMVAIRHLWRRQIEMYLALQLQEVLEKSQCRSSKMFPSFLHSTACSANTPAVQSPSRH